MSEYNMTTRGGSKVNSNAASDEFEISFLEAIEPALPSLAARGIKVAVNAGASDTKKLYDVMLKMVQKAGLNLKLAWIGGDEVSEIVQKAISGGEDLKSLTTGRQLKRHRCRLHKANITMEKVKTFRIGVTRPSTPSAILAVGELSKP